MRAARNDAKLRCPPLRQGGWQLGDGIVDQR
jgi:hypothetical protein